MSDLIRRQDVIDALLKMDSIVTEERIEEMNVMVDDLIKKYKDLKDDIDQHLQNYSSAQTERKMGKWIKEMNVKKTKDFVTYTPKWYCEECGTEYDPAFAEYKVNYCYNCGADMRGGEEDGN